MHCGHDISSPTESAAVTLHFLFPGFSALCVAENATHTLHNLLTLRGAVVRDPHVWSRYLNEALTQFGDPAEVVFASHHWPTQLLDSIAVRINGPQAWDSRRPSTGSSPTKASPAGRC